MPTVRVTPPPPNNPPPCRRRIVAGKSGSITVSVEKNTVPHHQTSFALPPTEVPVPWGEVRLGLGITQNLGNFESLRIDAAVVVPCGTTTEEYDAAKARASELAQRYVEEERAAALGTEGVTSR
jgi:hypothetical protein